MKRLLVTAAFTLLIAACSKSPQEAYQDLKDKAAEQLANYEFAAAESTYIDILFADTTRFDGPIGLALSAERQLLHWDAMHLYMKLGERNPRLPEAALGAMRVATRLGLEEMALDRAGVAMQLLGESDGGTAIVETARRILKTPQPAIARQLVERAVEAGQPEAIGDLIRGHAFFRERQFDSADIYLERARSAGNPTALFHRLHADYLERRGQFDSAIRASAAARELDPDNFDLTIEHFNRAVRLGYYNEARAVIHEIRVDGEGSATHLNLKLAFQWANGQRYEALGTAVYLLDLRPYTLSAHLMNLEANAVVSNFITCSAELQFVEGQLNRGNYVPAFRDFMSYRLAIINSYLDDHRVPLQQLQGRVNSRTSEREHRLREMYLLHRVGAWDEFEAKVDTVFDLYEDNVGWLTGVADVFADSSIKLFDRAVEAYERALELDPWYRPAFEGYVEVYRLQKKWPELQVLMDRFGHFGETYADLHLDRAVYRAWANEPAAATSFLASVEPLEGSIPYWERMMTALRRNQAREQLVRLTDAINERLPDNPDAMVFRVQDLNRRGEFETILTTTERLLETYPDNADLRAHHAYALYRTGEEDEAFEEFEQLKQEREDNSELLHLYSRALAESGRDGAEAQNQARRAVFSGPEVYRDFINLAYVYMLTGRPDLARGEARRASTTYPDQPEAYYYMGYSLYLENSEGAEELLQKALDLGLTGEDAKRARDALNDL